MTSEIDINIAYILCLSYVLIMFCHILIHFGYIK